jgi:outer membrane protein assembly factor BamB
MIALNVIRSHLKGSYDKHLYVLRIKDGSLEWKFETMESIKSSPFINQENGYVYFGSHDKMLYCLDIEVKFKFIRHVAFSLLIRQIYLRKNYLYGLTI